MIAGTPEQRFDLRFAAPLDRAWDIAGYVNESISDHIEESISTTQFPESTVLRVLTATTPFYSAAINCLRRPESTLGALVLLRPLIEAWSHLWFIAEKESPEERSSRALRLELGWANDLANNMKRADYEEQTRRAEQRLLDVKKLFNQRGARGGMRTEGDVRQTLRAMKSVLPEIEMLYDSASQASHAGGWDWQTALVADGRVGPTLPPPSHRAARLNHVVVIFRRLVTTGFDILGVSDAGRDRLNSRSEMVLRNQAVCRAIDGDFD